ncbi:MAG: Tol-Pal system beta propeller repeat protein TolB [bacterium]
MMRFLLRLMCVIVLISGAGPCYSAEPALAERLAGLDLAEPIELAQIMPNQPVDIGVVRPSGRILSSIAIPALVPKAGSPASYKKGFLSEIIYNDLELSGYFQRAKNQQFVEETHDGELKTGQVNFPEWIRLGANFLLVGDYTASGESLSAEIVLYDVPTGGRIMGKQYENYNAHNYRRLAHRISDDIVEYITHEPGIARTQIAYTYKTGKTKEIYVMDADGFNPRPLTNDRSLALAPCWGAGGTELYLTSYSDHNPDLRGVFVDGSRSWWISRRPGFNFSAAWNPGAQRIALTLGKDGNSEIYTMDRNGQDLQRLTKDHAIDSSPCWSPDGSRIVFTSDRGGSPQLYAMDAGGGGAKRITYQGTYNDSAAWSPKGDRIAFVARAKGIFNIYVMNPDGSNWVQLTANQGDNEDPCWSPNGLYLTFSSNRTGTYQVYRMNGDGSNVRVLTSAGDCQSPAWGPIPTGE